MINTSPFETREFIHNIWTKNIDQLDEIELITGTKELKKHIYYTMGCLKQWNTIILDNPPDIKKNKKHVTQLEILEQFMSFVPTILPCVSPTHSHIINYMKSDMFNFNVNLESLKKYYNDITEINLHSSDPQIVSIIYGFKLMKECTDYSVVYSEELSLDKPIIGYEIFSDIFTLYTGRINKTLNEYEIKRHKGCHISCKELFGVLKKDRTDEIKLYNDSYNIYLTIITPDDVDVSTEFKPLILLLEIIKEIVTQPLNSYSTDEYELGMYLYNFLCTFSYKNKILKFADALINACRIQKLEIQELNKEFLRKIISYSYNPYVSPWDCIKNNESKKPIIDNWLNNLKRLNIKFHRYSDMLIDEKEHIGFKIFIDNLIDNINSEY